ncbi:putative TetR family transcriptional regulator [Gordonia rhizosphera NBRC 16068]|uniref:Putative TetR family transcriptional regulator n=1 Tax=Gordonia rhizosphera NBRC 16068 TaxID=1108045 RepID=K6W742_9ACTN|nr:putative TetR family transcriptional regulator [Gordonia rhizosphera NBRC 16068]
MNEIIDGAFELASDVTVDNLSMPMLAKRLDLGVTSIYWHFRSKDRLLDAMTERAIDEFDAAMPIIGPDEGWQRALCSYARSMRTVFRDRPVLCDLLVVRPESLAMQVNRPACGRLEAVIAMLVDVGFTPAAALDVFLSISVHTRGVVMVERRQDLAGGESVGISIDNLDVEAMPYLTSLFAEDRPVGEVIDRIFELGLDALIDRADRTLASAVAGTTGERRVS